MLEIQNLTFGYNRHQKVLDDFTFNFTKGGIYGLLGRNGAGKSTLLYLIAGLLTPRSGSVMLNGISTRLREPSTLCDIMLVPEEFVFPAIPLERYINLYAPLYPRFDRDSLYKYLEIFSLSPDINLGALSMGQKKKAYISFALACNTSIVLMDEPSNGLDIPSKSAFRRAISAAASEDRLILISTHQVRDIDLVLDHILIMDNHQMILNASVNEIVERLSFFTTTDMDLIQQALYGIPSLEGTAIVKLNPGNEFTEMNLETLFGFALDRPDILAPIFSTPRISNPE